MSTMEYLTPRERRRRDRLAIERARLERDQRYAKAIARVTGSAFAAAVSLHMQGIKPDCFVETTRWRRKFGFVPTRHRQVIEAWNLGRWCPGSYVVLLASEGRECVYFAKVYCGHEDLGAVPKGTIFTDVLTLRQLAAERMSPLPAHQLAELIDEAQPVSRFY